VTERRNAIANGFMADPDVPRSLEDAITTIGTCEDSCPEYERVTRIVQKDVNGPEMVCNCYKQKTLQPESNIVFVYRTQLHAVASSATRFPTNDGW
jgi:hypothetical protein